MADAPDDLFRRLMSSRTNQSGSPGNKSEYSVHGSLLPPQQGRGLTPFRQLPGQAQQQQTPLVRPAAATGTAAGATAARPVVRRTEGGDRPAAFQPPAAREQGVVYEWEPPTWGDVFKDVAVRCFEVALGAAAYAVGEEIWYFFRERRLMPRNWRPPGK